MEVRGVTNKFNRGEVDPRALNRDDVTKVVNSCVLMENFMPQRLGPMIYRPGRKYCGAIEESYTAEFISSTANAAIVAFTPTTMGVWIDCDPVTRVGTTLEIDQDYESEFWNAIALADSSVDLGGTLGIELTGDITGSATAHTTMTATGTYLDVEASVLIHILRGPVRVRIGQTGVDSSDLFDGVLTPGYHSLVFTPTTALPTITLSNSNDYLSIVASVDIEAAGVLSLPLPSTITDLMTIRYAQSADVMFVATGNTPQFLVERRGIKSWSVVPYRVNNGPFNLINNTEITLTAAALSGDTTLTASAAFFKTTDVGKLYKLTSAGQTVTGSVTAADDGTPSIRVTGVGDAREFVISRSGTWVGTVTLQRSTDDATWSDIQTWTTNGSGTYRDDLDNSTLYYRLWVKTGEYTSGTVILDMVYTAGSIDGIGRVVAYTSTTVVTVQVLQSFGSTIATRDWYVGSWSEDGGYPTAVSLYEGRVWWAGSNMLWGSESDAYSSMDDEVLGDSAAIQRTIGFGPVDNVEWLAPSSRLMMGLASDEISVRSSSFGEVLTPTNINLKSGSSQGAAPISPIKIDDSILYVQRSKVKIIDLSYSLGSDTHEGIDLMTLNPGICLEGVKRLAVSRQPETRVYVVMDDGTMRVYLMDPAEDVAAWSRITTDGTFEDVVALPGLQEDIIHVTVLRNGVRSLEQFSRLADVVTEHFDAFVSYSGAGYTLTGLSHLEGETVGVWGDGQDRGTYVVASGQITVAEPWIDVVVGLPYVADYKSNKLSAYVPKTVQGQRKRVLNLSFAMLDYWPNAITFGPSFTELQSMPTIENGKALDTTTIVDDYDETPTPFPGNNDIDARICLRATGPCTILAFTFGVEYFAPSKASD